MCIQIAGNKDTGKVTTATIEDCTIREIGAASSATAAAGETDDDAKAWQRNAVGAAYNATLTIKNSTISSMNNSAVIVHDSGGELNVESGTYSGGLFVLYARNSPNTTSYPGVDSVLNVKGGKFTSGKIGIYNVVGASKCAKIIISGGIFAANPGEDYLATGYKWDKATGAVINPLEFQPDKGELHGKDIETPTGKHFGVSMTEIPGIVANVQLAATEAIVEKDMKVGRQTVLDAYETVFITLLDENNAPIQPGSPVTVTIDAKLEGVTVTDGLGVLHGKTENGTLVWEKVSNVNVTKDDDSFYFGFTTSSFSPFALVKLSQSSAPSKSSSTPQGSYIWLTNDTPAEPKVTPTPTPTPGPVETPSVKPIENPSDVPAKTPAPFLGILAGLGAAAVVFGLRRK